MSDKMKNADADAALPTHLLGDNGLIDTEFWDPQDEDYEDSSAETALRAERKAHAAATVKVLRGMYIETDRDDQLRDAFETLIEERESNHDVRRFVGISIPMHSGAGKSRMLANFLANHPLFKGYPDDPDCPLIRIDTPSPVSNKSLGLEVLRQIYPQETNEDRSGITVDARLTDIWDEARRLAAEAGVWVLVIDEAHDLLNGGPKTLEILRSTLKRWCSHQHKPVLILAGTPQLDGIFDTREMRRRFIPIEAAPLDEDRDGYELRRIIARYARTAEIGLDQSLLGILGQLIHAGTGELGWTVDMIIEAIRVALIEGSDRLAVEHFAEAYRRVAKCQPQDNVFLVPDWKSIDTAAYRRAVAEQQSRTKRQVKREDGPW